LVLPEGLLDDFGDDQPGDDAEGSAEHIVVVLVLDFLEKRVTGGVLDWRRGTETNPGWPGAQDLAKALNKGVPLLVAIEEGGEPDSFEKTFVGVC